MKWWEIAIHIIGITFSNYAHIKCYSILFKNEIRKMSIPLFIEILIITALTFYNTFYIYGPIKIAISFIEILVLLKITFNENIKTAFLKSLLIYLLGFIVEMLIGLFVAYFFIDNLQEFDENIAFKFLFSILLALFMLLASYIPVVKKTINKIYNAMYKIFNMTILIALFITTLVLLTYYLIISSDILSMSSIILLILLLSILLIISIQQTIKTKISNDKQEILLDFMKEYEMIIDKERIDRHEMVNNLLVLKSFKNKNPKEYNKILDDTLLTYQSNKIPSGLYELPSGLKGLFYYKIYDMKSKSIEVFVNISNKILKDLDNLDSKTLTKTCKILGILLDNAKESASESRNKLVTIDLYKEDNDIIIYIENTMKENNIDLDKMKIKGFSTKGNNRGYGLYIVNNILNKSNNLSLNQIIENNNFVSILTIKK